MKTYILTVLILFSKISLAQKFDVPKIGQKYYYEGYIKTNDYDNNIKKYRIKPIIKIIDIMKNADFVMLKYSSDPDDYFAEDYSNLLKSDIEERSFLFVNNKMFKILHKCTYDSMKVWLKNKKFKGKKMEEIEDYSDGRVFLDPYFDHSSNRTFNLSKIKKDDNEMFRLVKTKKDSTGQIEKFYKYNGGNKRISTTIAYISPFVLESFNGSLVAWGKINYLVLRRIKKK